MKNITLSDACQMPVFYKVISETEKALNIIADDVHAINKISVWIPKSVLQLDTHEIITKEIAERNNYYRLAKWFEKKMDYRTAKALNRTL
jgi:hypothetical protein